MYDTCDSMYVSFDGLIIPINVQERPTNWKPSPKKMRVITIDTDSVEEESTSVSVLARDITRGSHWLFVLASTASFIKLIN